MVTLLPFERSDFDRLIGWVPSAEFMMQWTGMMFQFPLTHEQLEKYLVRAEKHPDFCKIWKVMDEDIVVGHIEMNNIWEHDRKASLNRVLIASQVRGKGLGKQMVCAALRHGFEELGLHRIELSVYDFNTQARQCYEACGFVQEGFQRESRRMGDGWWNNVQMAILEQEWRARQEG